jgi:tyrosine-protein phosphatase YwqE
LIDTLNGYVDIKNHILPVSYDGAKNIKDCINIITSFSKIGIKHLIATPPIMDRSYQNKPQTIHQDLTIVRMN